MTAHPERTTPRKPSRTVGVGATLAAVTLGMVWFGGAGSPLGGVPGRALPSRLFVAAAVALSWAASWSRPERARRCLATAIALLLSSLALARANAVRLSGTGGFGGLGLSRPLLLVAAAACAALAIGRRQLLSPVMGRAAAGPVPWFRRGPVAPAGEPATTPTTRVGGFGRHPASVAGTNVPAGTYPEQLAGWWLLAAFGSVLLLASLVPQLSGRDVGPHEVSFTAVMTPLLIAGACVAGSLAARAGYYAGFVFGAGCLVIWSAALIAEFGFASIWLRIASEFGTDISVGPGLVLLGISGVIGVAAIVAAARVGVRSGRGSDNPLMAMLAVTAALGVTLYLVGLLAGTEAGSLWDGPGWFDLVVFIFIAMPVVAGLGMLALRTAAASAFLAGGMFLPFVSWIATSVGADGTTSPLTDDGRTIAGMIISTIAALLGVAVSAERSFTTGHGHRHLAPANGSAIALIGTVAVIIGAIVGLT